MGAFLFSAPPLDLIIVVLRIRSILYGNTVVIAPPRAHLEKLVVMLTKAANICVHRVLPW